MTANCSLSNRTIAFNAQFNKTHECISTNRTHACPYCVENYQELNDLYDKIRSLKRDKFCFDTKDKVNELQLVIFSQVPFDTISRCVFDFADEQNPDIMVKWIALLRSSWFIQIDILDFGSDSHCHFRWLLLRFVCVWETCRTSILSSAKRCGQ